MQTLLAAATEQDRAAFLQSLGHASDELRQITVLLAGLDLTIRIVTAGGPAEKKRHRNF